MSIRFFCLISSGLILLASFTLIVPSAYALENKDDYFGGTAKESVRDFLYVKIRGTVSEIPNSKLPSTLVLLASGKTYIINISASTKIVRKIGSTSSLKEFIIGDTVEVAGSININGTIEGKSVKNLSISQPSYKNFDGIVKSINAAANSFAVVKNGKKYAIKANKTTKIVIPGIRSKILLSGLKAGDYVYGRIAPDNIKKYNAAKIISVLRRNSIETEEQKITAFDGVITAIGSTALPAKLEIFNGAGSGIVSVSGNTVIVRNNFSKSSLVEFQVGDTVKIIGTKDKVNPLKINAKLLKNDNLKTLNDLTVDMDRDGVSDVRDVFIFDHDNDAINDDSDIDDDNDGITDITDGKPFDFDNDGIEDAIDQDDDNDGITDGADANPLDHDNDAINDDSDTDDDNDGITDSTDSKPFDHDNDGLDDAADQDDDNDSIADSIDTYPFDHDNDGINDDSDTDDDNDGLTDSTDSKPFDHDNDGIDDLYDLYPFQFNNGKIAKIGHRGALGYAPENTLKSLQKALELGAEMIEIDVRICKTGELIVMHDSSVDRTTNGTGQVANLTFAELRLLDAGDGEKIPTLAEVIDFTNRRAQIIIELKDPGTAMPVLAMIEGYVQNGWNYENFIISSFDNQELSSAQNLNKNIKISANIKTLIDYYAAMNSNLNFWSISFKKELINGQNINETHNRGVKVFAWVANDQYDIELMESFDIDGIISDFPDRL